MSEKNVLAQSKKRRIYLNKITANRIDKNPESSEVDVNQNVKYVILNNSKESISIKVTINTCVKPEALFSIETEHIIEFIGNEEITNGEISNNIGKVIAPLGADVSYIIASITKEMIGSPMILPPVLSLNKTYEE